jgi:hypothetical protein
VGPGPVAGREDEHARAEPRERLFACEYGGDGLRRRVPMKGERTQRVRKKS